MLELGSNSIKHHVSIAKMINKLDIDKVHIYGNHVKKNLRSYKKK